MSRLQLRKRLHTSGTAWARSDSRCSDQYSTLQSLYTSEVKSLNFLLLVALVWCCVSTWSLWFRPLRLRSFRRQISNFRRSDWSLPHAAYRPIVNTIKWDPAGLSAAHLVEYAFSHVSGCMPDIDPWFYWHLPSPPFNFEDVGSWQ